VALVIGRLFVFVDNFFLFLVIINGGVKSDQLNISCNRAGQRTFHRLGTGSTFLKMTKRLLRFLPRPDKSGLAASARNDRRGKPNKSGDYIFKQVRWALVGEGLVSSQSFLKGGN
jgi:hypothetical protein